MEESFYNFRLGFLMDPIGVVISILGLLLAFLFAFREKEGLWWAALISTLGISTAWLSDTLWLTLIGITLTILGGFIGIYRERRSTSGANLIGRYLQERLSGLFFSFAGASILANQNSAVSAWVGAVVLGVGIIFQLQSFPFQGWSLNSTPFSTSIKIMFTQVFPFLATDALLFRFDPYFRSIGLFPGFGWVLLILLALTLLIFVFQDHSRTHASMGLWASLSFLGVVASHAFAGPLVGVFILLAVVPSSALLILSESAGKSLSKLDWGYCIFVMIVSLGLCVLGAFTDVLISANLAHRAPPSLWISQLFILLLFCVVSYLLQKKQARRWSLFREPTPSWALFFRNGLEVDQTFANWIRRIDSPLKNKDELIRRFFGAEVIGSKLEKGLLSLGVFLQYVSGTVTSGLNGGLSKTIRVPSKTLQLIQNGNVQWYLYFALGSGIVLLVHFIRKG